jgi:hypothetical protein
MNHSTTLVERHQTRFYRDGTRETMDHAKTTIDQLRRGGAINWNGHGARALTRVPVIRPLRHDDHNNHRHLQLPIITVIVEIVAEAMLPIDKCAEHMFRVFLVVKPGI